MHDHTIEALIIRIGFPLKGSLKGSIVGFYSVGALIIRIGFWGPLSVVTIRNPTIL